MDRQMGKQNNREMINSQINRWLYDEILMREIMYSSSQLLIDKME
jgi:hypothetical protein